MCGTESFVLVGAVGKWLNRGRVGSLVTIKCSTAERRSSREGSTAAHSEIRTGVVQVQGS